MKSYQPYPGYNVGDRLYIVPQDGIPLRFCVADMGGIIEKYSVLEIYVVYRGGVSRYDVESRRIEAVHCSDPMWNLLQKQFQSFGN